MILELLFSTFACIFALSGTILAILMSYLIIKDIIDNLRKWYKGDDWGWTEILGEYGYQRRYG